MGESSQTTAALHEFEQVLAAYQEADRKLNRAVIVAGLILLAVGMLGCYWLVGLWG